MKRKRTALRAMVNMTNKVIAPRNTPKRASTKCKLTFQGRPFPKRKLPSCANCAKNMGVLPTPITHLSARSGRQVASQIKNGVAAARSQSISMSTKMLV
eukprot:7274138-Ditylum_brightwellii.AAC.1